MSEKQVITPANINEAIDAIQKYGFPVDVTASYTLGGWRKTAYDLSDLRKHFEEGKRLSPISEVHLNWK